MNRAFTPLMKITLSALCLVVAVGCNPVSTAVKIGIHAVGSVVEEEQTQKVGAQLLGKRPSEADAVLGQTIDVYADVKGSREWRVYPVPLDVLNNHRYVVEVADNRIVLVQRATTQGEKLDIPLKLFYDAKLKGKTPAQCEADLKMGPPILAMRSKSTGQLVQMYDARLIKELPKPHYCVVRFDKNGACENVKFAEIGATAS